MVRSKIVVSKKGICGDCVHRYAINTASERTCPICGSQNTVLVDEDSANNYMPAPGALYRVTTSGLIFWVPVYTDSLRGQGQGQWNVSKVSREVLIMCCTTSIPLSGQEVQVQLALGSISDELKVSPLFQGNILKEYENDQFYVTKSGKT